MVKTWVFGVLCFASAAAGLGSVLRTQREKDSETTFYSWDEFHEHNRQLQTFDASEGNSYALYGVKVGAEITPDYKSMAKKCFSGLGMRGCDVRQR